VHHLKEWTLESFQLVQAIVSPAFVTIPPGDQLPIPTRTLLCLSWIFAQNDLLELQNPWTLSVCRFMGVQACFAVCVCLRASSVYKGCWVVAVACFSDIGMPVCHVYSQYTSYPQPSSILLLPTLHCILSYRLPPARVATPLRCAIWQENWQLHPFTKPQSHLSRTTLPLPQHLIVTCILVINSLSGVCQWTSPQQPVRKSEPIQTNKQTNIHMHIIRPINTRIIPTPNPPDKYT